MLLTEWLLLKTHVLFCSHKLYPYQESVLSVPNWLMSDAIVIIIKHLITLIFYKLRKYKYEMEVISMKTKLNALERLDKD